MPNRILRDWTDSPRVEQLSAEAERLFVRLIMRADDFGRYHADVRMVRAGCFPLLRAVRDTDISRWIAECEKAGLIAVYRAKGRDYLAIRHYEQRVRESKSKFPAPDGQPPTWFPSRGDDPPSLDGNPRSIDREPRANDGLGAFGDVGADEGSSAPPAAATEPDEALVVFPVVGNPELPDWPLTKARAKPLVTAFPDLDVAAEAAKALSWVLSLPRRRKTAAGMMKFLHGWMNRAQNEGGARRTSEPKPMKVGPQPDPETGFVRAEVRAADIRLALALPPDAPLPPGYEGVPE